MNSQQLCQALSQAKAERAKLRQEEADLCARENWLQSQSQVNGSADLRTNLSAVLPLDIMPGNVGPLNSIAWDFWEPAEVNFGMNPLLSANSIQNTTFRVDQDGAFLMLGIIVTGDTARGGAGLDGPYQVVIRDRQSSRTFNDQPIPLQALGSRVNPRKFPTPLLFQPNAYVQFYVTTWLPQGTSQQMSGSGRLQFAPYGVRVRIEDTRQTLGNIFQSGS